MTRWPHRIRRTCPKCGGVCDYSYVYQKKREEFHEECTVCSVWFYIIVEGNKAWLEEWPK